MIEDKLKAALMAEFNAIPPREELEKMYTFSERHNKMMEAIFAEMRRRERFERYFRAVRRVAIVMLALIGCAVVSLKVVPTVYAYVEAWITENVDDRLIFKDNDSGESSKEKEDLRFELGYVPEGYEYERETIEKAGGTTIYYKHYSGAKLNLSFFGKSGGNKISMNTEEILTEEVIIDRVQYYVFEHEEGMLIVTWESEGYLLKLKGELEKADMLDVASSVKYVKYK